MNSFLIKLNKAWRIIWKNGFFSGGKIVGEYLVTYFKSFFVKEGDILFITGGVGDKAHFRAFGIAEELKIHDFKCSVTMADNFRLQKYVNKFNIFVFHKIFFNEKIVKFIAEIKKQNKEIIFDTDDLDFDPQYFSQMEYFSQISDVEKKEYEKGIGSEILNDAYVKNCTTTVSYLAQKIKEKGKKVFIVSNKISEDELEIANRIIEKEKKQDGFLRIGYFSGTPSHNKDFATISDAILKILKENKKVKLILAGPLDVEDKLQEFKNQIETLPRVSRNKYYNNLWKCDINLVPLELNNPFCESKSEIKFIEAGVLKIPTIATCNQTYREVITDGENGLLASSRQEWEEKIQMLLQNKDLRVKLGEKAREKVLQDFTNKNSHSDEYYEYLKFRLSELKK